MPRSRSSPSRDQTSRTLADMKAVNAALREMVSRSNEALLGSMASGDYPDEIRRAVMKALGQGRVDTPRGAMIRRRIRRALTMAHYEMRRWNGLWVMRNLEHPAAPVLWFEEMYRHKEPVFIGIEEDSGQLWDVPEVFNYLYIALVMKPKSDAQLSRRTGFSNAF